MLKENNRVYAIYADSWEELTLNMIGWYHDHCRHMYAGRIAELPEHLHWLIYKKLKIGPTDEKRYVFLCEEDAPVLV